MDGYAFAGSQLVPGQPLTLRSVGTALAGKAWTGTVNAGECVKIMTGAIMPAGLDTVVPQEFTTPGRPDHHRPRCAAPGRQPPLQGRRLDGRRRGAGPWRIAHPSRAGLGGQPGAQNRDRVAAAALQRIFSTGDEILSLGEPPREGAVYDSNRYTVFGLLTRLGVEVIDMGVVRDDPPCWKPPSPKPRSAQTPSSQAAA